MSFLLPADSESPVCTRVGVLLSRMVFFFFFGPSLSCGLGIVIFIMYPNNLENERVVTSPGPQCNKDHLLTSLNAGRNAQ